MNFDLQQFIKTLGYFGVWAIVFAESGLFIGFLLPGDSLLFTAGFISSQGFLSLPVLSFGCFVCAVLGDNVGYTTGYRFGRKLFQKEDSFFFRKEHLIKTEEFYEKHGKKTIILARFLPWIRTFAPIVAGIAAMRYKVFIFYNVLGGFFWAVGLTYLGYFLGSLIPPEKADHYLLPIVLGIIVMSFVPLIYHFIQEKLEKKRSSKK